MHRPRKKQQATNGRRDGPLKPDPHGTDTNHERARESKRAQSRARNNILFLTFVGWMLRCTTGMTSLDRFPSLPSPTWRQSSKATPFDRGRKPFFTGEGQVEAKALPQFQQKQAAVSFFSDSDRLVAIESYRRYEEICVPFGPVTLISMLRLAETALRVPA